MEKVDRYIYAVIQKLPQQQRTEIEMELRGLIEDMLEERVHGGSISSTDVENVLLELGDPRDLAAKYRGYHKYLISPELFYPYISVLKVVLIALFIAITIASVVEFMTDPLSGIEKTTNYIGSIIDACFQGFAWVTIIFAVIDNKYKFGVPKILGGNKEWSPSSLPPIPHPSSRIKPIDSIFGIIFSVVFFVLFTSLFDLIGVYFSMEGHPSAFIPLFNEQIFRSYLPLIFVMFGLGLLRECLKLISGKWTMKLAMFNLFYNITIFILTVIILTNPTLWNPDFMSQLVQSGVIEASTDSFNTVNTIWTHAKESIVLLLSITMLIDTAVAFKKAYKV